MPAPQPPKYQIIYTALREQILAGSLKPGEQLPSQQEMAESYNTSLMTLRQAMAGLESEGLINVVAGKGTFVADRPIDVRVGNLSSFAGEMRSAGVDLASEVLDVQPCFAAEEPKAAAALGVAELTCVLRRRSVDSVPFSLQRSYLASDVGDQIDFTALVADSLYRSIEVATGWTVSAASETIRAVNLDATDAELLDADSSQPSLLSIRTSLNQFDVPFLYDSALLVGDRCTIAADRRSDRLSISYGFEDAS